MTTECVVRRKVSIHYLDEAGMTQIDLRQVHSKILLMKKTADELRQMGREFPALARNTVRILASLKMLEINVSDIVHLDFDD